MLDIVTNAFVAIIEPCYQLTGNWWMAVLLFTVLTKVILLPLSLWCQWNSIIMVKLMPELNRLKIKYYGDAETIGEKQAALYKEKHYHPMLSLVPLAIQVLILFGLVDAIHLITDHGTPGTELLGLVPSEDGGIALAMPVLAALSAAVMGFAQNRINPLQKEQSSLEKNTTNGFSIALSLFLGFFVATGMGFYWVVSNLTAIAIQALCNVIIKPKKFIDYADLADSRAELEELESLDGKAKRKWYQRDPLGKREKQDFKRFFKVVDKHLVVYSEGSGFYKYFKGAIEYVLAHTDGNIHYVTNDPNDQVFELAKSQPRIKPYYIGQKRAITLMMKMDADVVLTTQEDLDNYYIKRSYVRDDVEYVFTFHHMTSTHMTALEKSYDNFDTLLCAGPHQIEEIRRAEQMRGLPSKKLVECGYPLLDKVIEGYKALPAKANDKPVVLIAPSWQEDCILDLCIDEMLDSLLGRGWKVIVRPHPEYTKRYKARWQALQAKYETVPEDELLFEKDFSSNTTVFTSDILVTDWSSISCEFSFATLKPTVFVDTPMKIGNPDYEKLGIEPTDISLRNQIGVSVSLDEVKDMGDVVSALLSNQSEWHSRIEGIRDSFIFNIGHSDEIAGEYLINAVLSKQEQKSRKGENLD